MIHSDFERGFIKAEVVAFEDFKVRGGPLKAHAAGELSVMSEYDL